MFNQNSPVDTRIAVLEEKFMIYEQMMNKMESAIQTISEAYQGISKMLVIHDQKLENSNNSDYSILEAMKNMEKKNEEEHQKVISKLDQLEKRIDEDNKEVKKEFDERIKEQNVKIDGLVRFRLLVGGAILLMAFLFTQQQIRVTEYLPFFKSADIVVPAK